MILVQYNLAQLLAQRIQGVSDFETVSRCSTPRGTRWPALCVLLGDRDLRAQSVADGLRLHQQILGSPRAVMVRRLSPQPLTMIWTSSRSPLDSLAATWTIPSLVEVHAGWIGTGLPLTLISRTFIRITARRPL